MSGRLTTHALDLARGAPAGDVVIEVRRVYSDGSGDVLARTRTNRDGRTDEPLVPPGELERGRYEIVFAVGAYHDANGARGFLDEVPVRFEITDPAADHHVPLLFTPWSYSVYRGS